MLVLCKYNKRGQTYIIKQVVFKHMNWCAIVLILKF